MARFVPSSFGLARLTSSGVQLADSARVLTTLPEPTGIGPVSGTRARAVHRRGHPTAPHTACTAGGLPTQFRQAAARAVLSCAWTTRRSISSAVREGYRDARAKRHGERRIKADSSNPAVA